MFFPTTIRSACALLALLTAMSAAAAPETESTAPAFATAAQNPPTGPGKGTRSEFFKTQGAMIYLQKSVPGAFISLTLSLERDLPANSQIKVQFQNPAAPGEHFDLPAQVDARRQVTVQSPKFDTIGNRRAYLARALVMDEQGQVIGTHEQWIWFELPAEFRSGFVIKITD